MIEVECPQCDANLEVADTYAGHAIACPECAASISVPVPASAQVIEVHAEHIGDDTDEVDYEEGPFVDPRERRASAEEQLWGRNVRFERVGNGNSCCPLGCMTIAAIAFFTLYGIISFFSG